MTFVLPVGVHAQGLGGYRFESFDARIELADDGSFAVTETIAGEFLEDRRGIFRFIPRRYETDAGGTYAIDLDLQQVTYNGEEAETKWSREGAYQVLRIGQEDVYISGPFEYVIRYSVDDAVLFHEASDEIYWNVTGDRWDVAPRFVSATVVLPEGVEPMENTCYTGAHGSQEQECSLAAEANMVTFEASDFLTVSTRFPKGVVPPPSAAERTVRTAAAYWPWAFLLIPLIAFGALFRYWQRHGRDPKGRNVVYARYEPPGDLRAAEVGTLIDGRVHMRDFSAAILELAVHGYLKIVEETDERFLLPDTRSFKLVKTREPDGDLREYERVLLEDLFDGRDEVEPEAIRSEFVGIRKDVQKALYTRMASEGYYVKNPNAARSALITAGVITVFFAMPFSIFAAGIMGRPVIAISFALTAAAFFAFAALMPKRTKRGADAFEHARGFKQYLEKAEKYRIQWQEKEGVFERFLPYATAFGVADKWAETFEGTEELERAGAWYVASSGSFDAGGFSSGITSFVSSLETAAKPRSSGGSGSAGGGFSGGGFGGGGGGSW